ncbi:MAG TPA: GNAT family N-acetyltransferase [Bryobacteraceae bacterium]|jgi:GNAT superfamily N-acetyltransferase|nr:GNAT family N-acetyltransferase [Bryobacteraceae bacterium]
MPAIRPATPDDAATIGAQRRSMFFDMGYRDGLDSMVEAFVPWVRERMSAGEYLGWLALSESGAIAAGAGLWLMDWPPHMIGTGRRGNILNVYTESAYRRQGLARRLTETAVEWCRANRIGVAVLHASEDGRPLYRSMGFTQSNEMRLVL